MEITTKDQYYQLWKNLSLGNRIEVFENLDEFLRSGFTGRISIRYREPGSPFKAFYIPADKVLSKVEEFIDRGASRHLFTFNESTPDDRLLIQGEAQYINVLGGLHLTYNTKQCSMKEAMANPQTAHGLKAKIIMEHYMNPKSFGMMRELFEIYPESAIEFGVYSKHLGVMLGHNTIIWEVRSY